MREECQYCGEPYLRGDSVDVGVGFMQMFADEPSCDCEHEMSMREQREDDEE